MKIIKIAVLLLISSGTFAQVRQDSLLRLSLQDAISRSRICNKAILVGKAEEEAATEDLSDSKASVLPSVGASGSYQRFTKLTMYTDGLFESKSVPKRPGPDGADLGLSASLNLYSGGRTRSLLQEQQYRSSLAELSTRETSGGVSLQVAARYLDLIRLSAQEKLTLDQVRRAETRLKNINALYKHQKVTRSDVLRAEVMLSNVQLGLEQIRNDLRIAGDKLSVLLDLSGKTRIQAVDSLGTDSLSVAQIGDLVLDAPSTSFSVLKFGETQKVQQARIKGIRSGYYPSVSVYSAYGLSYPNTIFFPPVDQAYSIGFVGLKVQYNLSAIYHNKHKVGAAQKRLQQLQMQKEVVADNTLQEAQSLGIKYQEASNRIQVIQKQIEQAAVNYKIVSSKYFNQLALLTDLLDADNLYQESIYNLVQAKAIRQLLVYRLKYTSGKL
ncbi:TolC family protein [Pedobacter ginsengisoli]|uniref:TolC family protein n=1 Tax=Pedobacter ginsengisoli TaxID=363852 RepID=UPI00254C92B8|nr:TolC family protein [Pedobacter ginsengisoli]